LLLRINAMKKIAGRLRPHRPLSQMRLMAIASKIFFEMQPDGDATVFRADSIDAIIPINDATLA
jgi:hypothetical protein